MSESGQHTVGCVAYINGMETQPLPPPEVCERAYKARDPRFDGRFFVGVLTTGIFCRPICPVRSPAVENVRFFVTAAAAQDAGYRPCRRCKPETARRLPEWSVGSETVVRALRLIDAGFLNEHDTEALAAALGISGRQLARLFRQHLDTTPLSLARMQRLQLARRLMDGSTLKLSDVAEHAGFGSVRRFNDEFRRVFKAPPSAIRGRAVVGGPEITLTLPLRPPFNVEWVTTFLAKRALPGVEEVVDGTYRRAVPLQNGGVGWLSADFEGDALRLSLPADTAEPASSLLPRVRRVFDLDADGAVIQGHLQADPCLGLWAERCPGIRVPGAWDGFETAVRAVLGQQVSVERARRLAVEMVSRYGGGAFPDPQALADADVAEIGMPGARGAAVRALAQAVLDGSLVLDECQDHQALTQGLCALRGIGPWTAGYIAMRVVKHPDAFLPEDWVVKKVLDATPRQAEEHSLSWRPWRAYALMLIWWASQNGER